MYELAYRLYYSVQLNNVLITGGHYRLESRYAYIYAPGMAKVIRGNWTPWNPMLLTAQPIAE